MIGKLDHRYVYPNQVRIYSQIGTICEPCSDINMLYAIGFGILKQLTVVITQKSNFKIL
ncbi:MAG: hypothetical protein EMLJLAPB_00711 [Candidatus Argoarchaeum ethanivorans]|uniref:Uncharacterized protein n=1 Tax=Candidatus Argoarchaeum ethanivorans TaxID=2608793 RepID=A0A811TH97_9EURY|nr:MAG: hypothetical protein EMLJLAPB_00711 [Candidatus Argoarchaeum ethanivorans]